MVFHRELGVHAFELVVLSLQVAKALHISCLHATVLGLPDIVRRIGNAQLTAYILDLAAALNLLQRGDNLALGELALAHRWSPWWLVCPETSSYGWINFTGSRHSQRHLSRRVTLLDIARPIRRRASKAGYSRGTHRCRQPQGGAGTVRENRFGAGRARLVLGIARAPQHYLRPFPNAVTAVSPRSGIH
ncbi:hypothetical protein XHV734_2366 [Xanthomonas hortorum pv. vitians]|nr:hypothetical protein XHV734_2366 [Xanthomonas hortorum pv. vitians]